MKRHSKDKFQAKLARMIRNAVENASGGGSFGMSERELDEIAEDLLDDLLWVANITDSGRESVEADDV